MKQKVNSIARVFTWIRPEQGDRKFFGSLLILVIAGFLIGVPKANATRVNGIGSGTTLSTGQTTLPATPTFPLKITSNGTYHIIGTYSGDPGIPGVTVAYGAALSDLQATARKSATGLMNAATNHGIYVQYGLTDVRIILENVGIQTTDATHAAFIIDGSDVTSATTAVNYQNRTDGSKVIVELRGRNYLFSCNNGIRNFRAGLEVWKGSTVYIEGNGCLIARSSNTRGYDNSITPPNPPTKVPSVTPGASDWPQGGPYWTGTDASLTEPLVHGGAAGIGSGHASGSGGNVVIREGPTSGQSPTVIAISSSHGAGIGGAWGTTNSGDYNGTLGTSDLYHSDILIYGGYVESWGGGHGAGIGGGCWGGDGNIVVLPTATVLAASYDRSKSNAPLGAMANVIYFGNPVDPRFAFYTDDFKQTIMYLDLSKNAAVRSVIERLGGGLNPSKLSMGYTRNDYPATHNQHKPNLADWHASSVPVWPSGAHVLLLNGVFKPINGNVAFQTEAKTEKNFSYDPVATTIVDPGLNYPVYAAGVPDYNVNIKSLTPQTTATKRFVMVAPIYDASVGVTQLDATPLYVGYDDAASTGKQIALTIGNLGNRRLYNPTIVIDGDDYELVSSPGTALQDAVDAALAGLVQSDAGGPYIPTPVEGGNTFTLNIRLIEGKNPGTSYFGYVLFGADDLPELPSPFSFKVDVIDKFLPPPDLFMETPTEPVVSGPFRLRAKFKNPATNAPPYPVKSPSGTPGIC
jgi:hypothetical protein